MFLQRALGALALLVSVPALAEPRGLELVWSAPPECPSERDITNAIEQLLGASIVPLSARAVVERRGPLLRLELTWRTATASATRLLEGDTCAELAQAAALMVALAADPEHGADGEGSAEPSPAAETPAAAPAAPSTTPAPAPPVATLAPEPPFAARLALALDVGSLPRATAGVGAGATVPLPPFALGLEVLAFAPRDTASAAGAGEFWLAALALRPCRPFDAGALWLTPCAAAELQLISSRGEGLSTTEERLAWYLRLGAGGEVVYAVSPRLGLVAGAWLLAAPARPTFVANGQPVYEPATVSARLALGFELRL